MLPQPKLTRIPGELPKMPSDTYVKDMSKLTKLELLEIKEREEKLLSNKARISKLPDKGKRIQDFYDKILKELEYRDEVKMAAKMFSDLNIVSIGKNKLNHLEWTGKCDSAKEITLDSDDDEETNPLKIIAQSTNIKKKVKCLQPEKSLVTEEDLEEIESFKNEEVLKPLVKAEVVNIDAKDKVDTLRVKLGAKLNSPTSTPISSTNSLDLEPHVLYLFEKEVDSFPAKEKFKPYKTTKSNVHDPEKEMQRKPWKNWEVTSATPPLIRHSGTKLLSLQDSVEIQTEYLKKLKELQEKQAQERLAVKNAQLGEIGTHLLPNNLWELNSFFMNYRNTPDNESETEMEMLETVEIDDGNSQDD